MWLLPTYGRPRLFDDIFDAPGGMPPRNELIVYLTLGDTHFKDNVAICERRGLTYRKMRSDARLGDILRDFAQNVGANTYGLVTDDHWPVTRGWWKALDEAAGEHFIAHSVDPKDTSPLPGPPCFGGALVRAMGTLAPGGLRHNYIDNAWRDVGADFDLIRPCPDVLVEHSHWIRDAKLKDATYERGSHDINEDRRTYGVWRRSQERIDLYARVAEMLGVKPPAILTMDLSKVRLSICLPLADGRIDVKLDESLCNSLELCTSYGMRFGKHVLSGGSNIGYSRELLMRSALAADSTHVMFVDDDMAWDDEELIARLIAADHDFTGVAGVKKQIDTKFCFRPTPGVQEFHPRSGFLKVRDVGFGLVIIKREVFDKMIGAYPKLQYNDGDDLGHALFCETVQVDPVIGKRLRLGEDIAFCWRWTALGGEIWIDHRAALSHIGKFDYTGCLADFMEADDQAKEAAE